MGIRDTIKNKYDKSSRSSCTVLSIVLKFIWILLLLAVILFIFVEYITPAIIELYRNFYQGYEVFF